MKNLSEILPRNEMYVRYQSLFYPRSPDFFQGMGILSEQDSVSMTFRNADGPEFDYELSAMPFGEDIGRPTVARIVFAFHHGPGCGWNVHLLDSNIVPNYLLSPSESCFVQYNGTTEKTKRCTYKVIRIPN